jgi:hypothetical protein
MLDVNVFQVLDVNVLQVWQDKKSQRAFLFALMKHVFGVPATSAPTERVVSTAVDEDPQPFERRGHRTAGIRGQLHDREAALSAALRVYCLCTCCNSVSVLPLHLLHL